MPKTDYRAEASSGNLVNQRHDITAADQAYSGGVVSCKDCHAVHLAIGAFMLTRVDDRFQVCDYCHTGGGGSKTNIQMDNAYDAEFLDKPDIMLPFGQDALIQAVLAANPSTVIVLFPDESGIDSSVPAFVIGTVEK